MRSTASLELNSLPHLGAGLGHRLEIDDMIRENAASIDWLEFITEQYMHASPEQWDRFLELRKEFVLIPHGVEMSIGTEGPLDEEYVTQLVRVAHESDAPWFSDHLSFTRAGGIALGHLVPLHRTKAVAQEVARKAQYIQSRVGIPFLLENIAYPFEVGQELTESEFLETVFENCDCGLLLDVTNVYTNSVNHRFDAMEFIDSLPLDRVVQIHIAGGEWKNSRLVDAHNQPVPEEVWDLLSSVMGKAPVRAILLERDSNFPDELAELLNELERARTTFQ